MQGYSGELRARVYLMPLLYRTQAAGAGQPHAPIVPAGRFPADTRSWRPLLEAPRKDTLPMHPELVALVREWIAAGCRTSRCSLLGPQENLLDGPEEPGAGRHSL